MGKEWIEIMDRWVIGSEKERIDQAENGHSMRSVVAQ
jgi:hypothetical protein